MLKDQIQGNVFTLSIISIILILWTLFIIFYSSKKWQYMPHSQTIVLLSFQALQCIGVLFYNNLDFSMEWARYLQAIVLTIGSYGSRINVCIIALTVLMLTKGKARIVSKMKPFLLSFGTTAPIVIVTILAFCNINQIQEADGTESHTDIQQFGFSQMVTTVTIYSVSLLIVAICLILSQMHYKRRKTGGGRVAPTKTKDGQSVLAIGRKVSDVLGFNEAVPEGAALEDCCQWKDGRKRSKNERDCQMVRYTVLLLYQSVLMFVGEYEHLIYLAG